MCRNLRNCTPRQRKNWKLFAFLPRPSRELGQVPVNIGPNLRGKRLTSTQPAHLLAVGKKIVLKQLAVTRQQLPKMNANSSIIGSVRAPTPRLMPSLSHVASDKTSQFCPGKRISGQNCVWVALLALAVVLFPSLASAQGLLVGEDSGKIVILPRPIVFHPPHPQPESQYKIKSLEVNANLDGQIAKVQVSQSFVNTGSQALEVSFVFPLPYDGAVDQLTLLVDGKEMPAKLLDATAARQLYEEIVRKNRDPALLEWVGTGLFKTSVFPVPPGAERKVTLRYSQVCRQWDGLTDFLFPLSTAKFTSHPIEEIRFNLAIESQSEIKNIYSPSHAVDIKRPDDKHAVVSYTPKSRFPPTTSGCSTMWAKASSVRECLATGPTRTTTAISCC